MASALFFTPQMQILDSNGDPASGALLYFYENGTTTPKDTYTDKALSTTHANPVVANSAGRLDAIFLDGEYSVTLKDADGVTIFSEDDVSGGSDAFGSATETLSTSTVLDSTYDKKHIEASGTITLTFPAISTAGEGFLFSVRNAGSAIVTLDANSSELINGSETLKLYPGDGCFLASGPTKWAAWGFVRRISPVSVTSTSYTVLEANKDKLHTMDASGGAIVATLPPISTVLSGFDVNFIKTDASANNVSLQSSDGINGDTNVILAQQYDQKSLTSDTTGYYILNQTTETATQAQQEAGSSTTVFVPPGRQHFHPSAAKVWVNIDADNATPAAFSSYNLTSIGDTAAGDYVVTFDTDFSGANAYCVVLSVEAPSGQATNFSTVVKYNTRAAGSLSVQAGTSAGALQDVPTVHVACFGDQP